MGIVPPAGHQEIAAGSNGPVVYHGGPVMRGVTIHTIFWAPNGFRFDGAPSGASLSYERLIQQFFTDVAADSNSTTNVFSVLSQYADGGGPGRYNITYNAAADSIDDGDLYPSPQHQCPSPAGVPTCVTDLELQREIDNVIRRRDPAGRGLHDIWFIFLPPNVDTCTEVAACGTNAYAGYHSLSNLGHGPVVYAVVPDPLIEVTPAPGSDPEANPEAESAINVAAHEAVEAIANPEGDGWMDPNGFEVGDMCESGPQQGTPLGFAPDGSPYNQLIRGDQYLIQMMWSNDGLGCEQRTTATASSLPLATVNLKQFSPFISGNIGTATPGVRLTVLLKRGGTVVADAIARTGRRGGWGPVALRSRRRPYAVGDDRDQISILYGTHGPRPDLILTGNGGDPFTQAGFTGWFDLDNGYALQPRSVLIGPCGQTGVLTLTVGGVETAPPVEQCETETDAAVVHTSPLRAGTALTMSSEDNRAASLKNPNGALVKLTIPLGEPGSVSANGNPQLIFDPTGFPSCTADLRAQAVSCTGLVPGAVYALTRRRRHQFHRATADDGGTIEITHLQIAGGDALTLTNAARRTLTVLHVAHLRVNLNGAQTVVASGTCEPGDYYGPPVTSPPASAAVGVPGASGTGTICPLSGSAHGLSAKRIEQTDDLSGGQTRTEVPEIEATSPIADETLYGPFIATAQAGLPGFAGSVLATGTPVALTITRAGSGRPVFHARNVDSASGVTVRGLPPGAYLATWVLTDAGGDTRTLRTRFFEAP